MIVEDHEEMKKEDSDTLMFGFLLTLLVAIQFLCFWIMAIFPLPLRSSNSRPKSKVEVEISRQQFIALVKKRVKFGP
jgi:hypothetical protein